MNTTIFTLLQNFILQEEIEGILAEFGFQDTARKCDIPTLLNYLVGDVAFEWKSLRDASDIATDVGLKLVDYSTLSKRLGELNNEIVKRIFELISGRLNRSARRQLNGNRNEAGFCHSFKGKHSIKSEKIVKKNRQGRDEYCR